jgi:hypothetical protein
MTNAATTEGEELFTYHNKHTTSSVKAFIRDNRSKSLYDLC